LVGTRFELLVGSLQLAVVSRKRQGASRKGLGSRYEIRVASHEYAVTSGQLVVGR
jgi:hypothetical protein